MANLYENFSFSFQTAKGNKTDFWKLSFSFVFCWPLPCQWNPLNGQFARGFIFFLTLVWTFILPDGWWQAFLLLLGVACLCVDTALNLITIDVNRFLFRLITWLIQISKEHWVIFKRKGLSASRCRLTFGRQLLNIFVFKTVLLAALLFVNHESWSLPAAPSIMEPSWELCKENVQPLKSGRSVAQLERVLNLPKTSKAYEERRRKRE